MAMKAALGHASMQPSDIDYINAHGTSTPMGDEIEAGRGAAGMFGDAAGQTVTMSSTKSAIGHLLGGAGAVEAGSFMALAIRDQDRASPTLNLEDPSATRSRISIWCRIGAKTRMVIGGRPVQQLSASAAPTPA